jgi:hypothetical protein
MPTADHCRAGASTVTEIAAVGAAAIYVPFPFAVDDHQTTNANFFVNQEAGWLMPAGSIKPRVVGRALEANESNRIVDLCQKKHGLCKKSMPPKKWSQPVRPWPHETRHSSYSFHWGRWFRHERHCRSLAELGLRRLRLGSGR